jgi:hypothetical protein
MATRFRQERRLTLRRRLILRGLALGVSVLAACTGSSWADDPPGMESGKLHDVAGELSDILHLTMEGKSLRLDRAHWEKLPEGKSEEDLKKETLARLMTLGMSREMAEQQVELTIRRGGLARLWGRLHSAAGSGSSSSGSSGRSSRRSFTSSTLSACMIQEEGGLFRMTVSESSSPARTIQFQDDGDGKMKILITGLESGLVLMIQQAADGKFRVAQVAGDKAVTLGDDSFLSFCGRNRQFAEKQLLPLLKHLGFGLPTTAYDPKVRAAVLSRLRGALTKEEADQAQALIDQLGDRAYAKREEATRLLSEGFARYQDLIEAARKATSQSAEMTQRLDKILQENADARKVGSVVRELKLDADPEFLILILKDAEDADRDVLVRALQRITGQKLGADVAAWEKWLEERHSGKSASRRADER